MAIVVVAVAAMPAVARAGDAAATITACKADRLTVAGRITLGKKSASKARGAKLQMRFQALALFGLPRPGNWRDVGKKTRASGEQEFTGLGADNWVGVLSWRYKRGSKTVLAGDERSQPLTIGGAKGKANCTVAEGTKPLDVTPPTLFILPADENWHRAPATVQLMAQDDFSGVQSVRYSIDGGPITAIQNGGTFPLPAEGAHKIDWAATDVAGNTGTRSATIRVDAGPPTKPVIARPPSVTASTTPTIQWSASTDTGSGLRGYLVTIKRGDGSVVVSQPVDANTTSLVSPVALTDGDTYIATVTAVDNTADGAWGIESDPAGFRVDTKPEVDKVEPATGTVLSGTAKDTNFVLTFDRVVDPASVSNATVVLARNAESGASPDYTVGCSNTPCTKIVVDPNGTLPEGRYTVTANGVKSGDGENQTFATFTSAYSVAFVDDPAGKDPGGGAGTCALADQTLSDPVTLTANAVETGTVSFDFTYNGTAGWFVRLFDTTAMTELGRFNSTATSGHADFTVSIPAAANQTLQLQFTSKQQGAGTCKLDTSNVVASRNP
ncbi:MAG: hypothetical protein QOJ29_533 [Thermoleophilaceae bacterium]|jgi:hypothetical protein|nr:hypothetical protein [Thermoleophilaceae bacterium]